jgi:hypothetical protein
MLNYNYQGEFKSNHPLKISKTISIEQEVHLSAICYMPDEEVFVLGGWNTKQIVFYDSRPEHYFEYIMDIDSQHIFNLSNLEYLEDLKFLFVGDCFSGLSIYR